jgi:hypothetical protein
MRQGFEDAGQLFVICVISHLDLAIIVFGQMAK